MDVSNFVALLLHGKRYERFFIFLTPREEARGRGYTGTRSSRLNQNSQDVTKIGASNGAFRQNRETKRVSLSIVS